MRILPREDSTLEEDDLQQGKRKCNKYKQGKRELLDPSVHNRSGNVVIWKQF